MKRVLAELGITPEAISKPRKNDDGLVDATEAMTMLRIRSRSSLHKMIDEGRLRVAAKLAGKNHFMRADVEALLAAAKNEAA